MKSLNMDTMEAFILKKILGLRTITTQEAGKG